MGIMFSVFPILFFLAFSFIIGTFIYSLARGARENHKNDQSPRLTTAATVVTKRTYVQGDHSHTTYFATFQFPSGDRLELKIPHNQFGYLVEGDRGNLTFQGTRFLSFDRT